MSNYILSDAGILSQIKRLQYRQQVLPLILIAASFVISALLQSYDWLKYLGYALTMLGVALYIKNFLSFRYRNRIVRPRPDAVYSPICGKLTGVKSQGELTQLSILKNWMDPVEIRCPADGCYWQDEALKLTLSDAQIVFRFTAKRMIRIPKAEMKAGEVIALMIGSGSSQILIPAKLRLDPKIGDNLDAAESVIYL
jgi:hypothetical protein